MGDVASEPPLALFEALQRHPALPRRAGQLRPPFRSDGSSGWSSVSLLALAVADLTLGLVDHLRGGDGDGKQRASRTFVPLPPPLSTPRLSRADRRWSPHPRPAPFVEPTRARELLASHIASAAPRASPPRAIAHTCTAAAAAGGSSSSWGKSTWSCRQCRHFKPRCLRRRFATYVEGTTSTGHPPKFMGNELCVP